MPSQPVKIEIGKRNIRTREVGSAAELGRELKAAMVQVAQDFGFFVDKLEGFLPEDLKSALEPTFELSQVYVPKDKGVLADSGYLEVVPYRSGARVEIGYGRGGQPPYAIYVHEVPRWHAPPTRDKFLEAAIDEDYYNILQRVTDRVRYRTSGR
jgi:hypothetical protein